MTSLRIYVFSAALTCTTLAVADAQPAVPPSWKHISETPNLDSDLVQCALQGGTTPWQVRFEGQTLIGTAIDNFDPVRDPVPYELDWPRAITEPPPAPPNARRSDYEQWATRYARDVASRVAVRVDDGWLIGFDAGEYGGSLWWYPRQPAAGRKLWSGNVRAILPAAENGTFVALSGLAHLGANEGAALWLDRDVHRQWRIYNAVSLNGAPSAHAVGTQGIVVAGLETVDLLTWSGDLRPLQKAAVAARPWSVALGPGGLIGIGRTLFVSVLSPRTDGSYREDWFVPEECHRLAYERLICVCAGGRK